MSHIEFIIIMNSRWDLNVGRCIVKWSGKVVFKIPPTGLGIKLIGGFEFGTRLGLSRGSTTSVVQVVFLYFFPRCAYTYIYIYIEYAKPICFVIKVPFSECHKGIVKKGSVAKCYNSCMPSLFFAGKQPTMRQKLHHTNQLLHHIQPLPKRCNVFSSR